MIDETHAYLRADQHVCAAVAALATDVRLGLGYRNSVPLKRLFRPAGRRVQVGVAYTVEFPAVRGDVSERNRGAFQRLGEWWEAQGYRVVRHDVDGPFRATTVVDPRDGFGVSLKQGKIGNLWVTAGSPWVRATGVKPLQEPPDCFRMR